ncbi:MAG: endonuclease III [Nitrososphaeraceae archaeon]|nr:endonuclease III [Nitrososphaeraceae archaeon]
MEKILHDKKPYRFTTLKQLQAEESGDPFKILIGTILSSRTRDENTTRVVKTLFKRFRNAKELAEGNIEEVKQIIHSIGFYNVKAKRIIEVSQLIVKRFDGKVPNSIEKLLELPGVGRKTANCVLVYGFNIPAIPVAIHVHRISNIIGLVNTKTPEKTEIELSNIIDRRYWLKLNSTFVMYGQNVCLPVTPNCKLCKLKKICKFYHSTN